MPLQYSYHSEHNADAQDRWTHFLLFVGAFIAILAAGQRFFYYFTHWSAADESQGWGGLVLGVVYLVAAVCLLVLGLRFLRASRGVCDRYVRVDDTHLSWHLLQTEKENRVALADIETAARPNVRDLTLSLKGGETVVLPIYLIANEDKQYELEALLGITRPAPSIPTPSPQSPR